MKDYEFLCVLLFCDLDIAKTMAKMFFISGKPGITLQVKLMKVTLSSFASYKMALVAKICFMTRNKGYISLITDKLFL